MGHIELARWAELVLVAPATADFLARLATGQADDLLTTLCLATEAPIAVAPAMNRVMWANAATQANVATAQAAQCTACSALPQAIRPAAKSARAACSSRWSSSTARTRLVQTGGPLEGQARADHRRPDARAYRPGSIHQQPQLRQDGLRGCAGGTRGGRGSRARQRACDSSRRRPACGGSMWRAPRTCWMP